MKVLIFYEHKAREYQYCCLLKEALNRNGISAAVCHNESMRIWRYRLFSLPIVTVGPSAILHELAPGWRFIDRYLSFFRGQAAYFINLQVEQVFSDDDLMSNYNILSGEEFRDMIYYVCWGERRRQQLLQRGIKDDKVIVTGAMHLDFLRPELSHCYCSKNELALRYGIAFEKKWVLFISSYTYADLDGTVAAQIAAVKKSVEGNDCVNAVNNIAMISKQSRAVTLEWIQRYLQSGAVQVFIYRPHPGEQIPPSAVNLQRQYPLQFFVIAAEPLQQWILVADLVDIWITTAVVDVFLSKKPCAIIQPVPPPEGYEPVTLDSNNAIRSYPEFERYHNGNPQFTPESFPINTDNLRGFYFFDTSPAYQGVCDLISHVLCQFVSGRGKTRFGLRRLFSANYLYEVVTAFYAATGVRVSYFSPVFRKKLRLSEEILRDAGEVFFSAAEKKIYRNIRNYIKNLK